MNIIYTIYLLVKLPPLSRGAIDHAYFETWVALNWHRHWSSTPEIWVGWFRIIEWNVYLRQVMSTNVLHNKIYQTLYNYIASYTSINIHYYIVILVYQRTCMCVNLKHVKLNKNKMPTKKKILWKIFGETWYRTRVVPAETKPLYALAYRAFNTELCSFNLTYSIFICDSGVHVKV